MAEEGEAELQNGEEEVDDAGENVNDENEKEEIDEEKADADGQESESEFSSNDSFFYESRKPLMLYRTDQLARPNKRCLLDTFDRFGQYLPQDKFLHLKKLIEEYYSMTPEQSEAYFNELKKEAEKQKVRMHTKHKMRLKQRKVKIQREKQRAKTKCVRVIKKLIVRASNTSMKNILITERMRDISDTVLQYLCTLLDLPEMPDRNTSDPACKLLISVSDWLAYWAENISYEVEIMKEKENEVEIDAVEGVK